MTVGDPAARVRHLVESLFRAAGVPCIWLDGCLRADLTAEAMTALEGRWAEPASLLLAFDPRTAEERPEADLVAPGSYRLERFLSWVRREVKLSRAFLPPLPPGAGRRRLSERLAAAARQGLLPCSHYILAETQAWEPYLLVAFLAARVGEVRRETLHLPGVNLVTGAVWPDMRPHLAPAAEQPQSPVARRRIPYRKAYRTALGAVVEELLTEDPGWAAVSRDRYEEEVRRLEAFYAELAREHQNQPETLAQLQNNRERRIQEQKDRLRPRALVRPLTAAFLHVPVVRYTVLLSDGLRDRRRVFTLDPLCGDLRPDAMPPAPPPDPAPRTPPSRQPGPELRPQPTAGRWPR